MKEVEFTGQITIPETEIIPVAIKPNTGEQKVELTKDDADIAIHSIYVANPNSVMVTVSIRPLIQGHRDIKFIGHFGNETKPVPFVPPIGPFLLGKLLIGVTGDGAEDEVIINIQYSRLGVV